MRYVYSIVRFVPDPARGEFINVGAIVGSEEASDWQVGQIENPVRARAIDEHKCLPAVWSFIDRIGGMIDRYESSLEGAFEATPELSEKWLEELCQRHRNIVQLSEPTPMVAENSDQALTMVFDQMLVDPSIARTHMTNKHSALAALRRAYRQEHIHKGDALHERVTLYTAHHRERIDFAVANGRTVQLVHTWSFQTADQDTQSEKVKAWGWTIQDAKAEGGRISTTDGRSYEVPPDVDVEVLYVAPSSEIGEAALTDANNVFERLHVNSYAFNDAPTVAARANQLLTEAGYAPRELQLR